MELLDIAAALGLAVAGGAGVVSWAHRREAFNDYDLTTLPLWTIPSAAVGGVVLGTQVLTVPFGSTLGVLAVLGGWFAAVTLATARDRRAWLRRPAPAPEAPAPAPEPAERPPARRAAPSGDAMAISAGERGEG